MSPACRAGEGRSHCRGTAPPPCHRPVGQRRGGVTAAVQRRHHVTRLSGRGGEESLPRYSAATMSPACRAGERRSHCRGTAPPPCHPPVGQRRGGVTAAVQRRYHVTRLSGSGGEESLPRYSAATMSPACRAGEGRGHCRGTAPPPCHPPVGQRRGGVTAAVQRRYHVTRLPGRGGEGSLPRYSAAAMSPACRAAEGRSHCRGTAPPPCHPPVGQRRGGVTAAVQRRHHVTRLSGRGEAGS